MYKYGEGFLKSPRFLLLKKIIMALRSKLEEIKGEKQKTAEEAEAAVQAENERAQLQEEEAFQATLLKRNTLKGALEELQGAKGVLKEAHGKRKGELKNILGLINEIKQENPEAELPTVKEAIAEPEEGSDEAQYVEAKQGVTEAISDVRNKKEALEKLGIATEGLDDKEVVEAVAAGLQQSNQEVRAYVREHPDSELPEAQEVKAEMVREAENQFLPILNRSVRRATESFAQGLEDYKNRLTDEERSRKSELLQHVSESALRGFLKDKKSVEETLGGLQKIKSAEEETFGPIEAEALAGALKMNLLGLTINYQGDRAVDHTYSGILNEKKSKLRFFLKDESGNIPEGFFYDDNSGITYEGLTDLSSQIETSLFTRTAKNMIEAVEKNREIESLPKEQESLENKVQERDSKRNDLNGLSSQRENLRRYIGDSIKRVEDLEAARIKMRILKADPEYATSNVSVEKPGFNRIQISIKSFQDAKQEEWEKMATRRTDLATAEEAARKDYNKARDAKRGWLNKKQLDEAEKLASKDFDTAIKNNKEVEEDTVFSEAKLKYDQISERYQLVVNQIREAVSSLDIPQEGISGDDFQSFQAQIDGVIERKIGKENEEKERLEENLEQVEEKERTLSSEIEVLHEDLKIVGSNADWRAISEYIQRRKERLVRDQETLLQSI